MKTLLSLLIAMLPVFLFGQTPMTIENLPNLTSARSGHVQLVPSPDKFLAIGGHVNNFNLTKSTEIFNTTTKTWQAATSSDNRDMSYVAKLANGKYLIGGGCSSRLGVGQLATTEIYNPADNSFTAAANMNVARTNSCAATLTDGRVLVVGNWYASADNAEIYDPVANTFTLTGACKVARALPVIIPTNDGGAIVCGGIGIYGAIPSRYVFEKYDPVSNTFSDLTTTLFNGETTWDIACYMPTMTQQYLMPDGKYMVLVNNTANTLSRLITIDPATNAIQEFKTQKPIPLVDELDINSTFGCGRTLMIDQTRKLIHIIQQGGIIQPAGTQSNIILRIVTINILTGSVNVAKMDGFDYSVVSSNLSMLNDGRILFSGGNKFDNFKLSDKAFIVTPATYTEPEQSAMSIEILPDLVSARTGQVKIITPPDKYTLIGGHVNGFMLTKNAEIYNSTTKKWDITTASDNRDNSFVAKLINGKYLIGGGCSNNSGVGQIATSEIYDPANNTFTAAANMNVARTNACAATLKDGRVLVVGNWYGAADKAEIYDPVANTFTLTGACLTARSNPIIIPTNDGGAIVFGGVGTTGALFLDLTFEKYNPGTNTFTLIPQTLFSGETLLDVRNGLPTETEQLKLPDGKYVVLLYNSTYTSLRLITIDPITGNIELLQTKIPIPMTYTEDPGLTFISSRAPMIDLTRNLIHIVQSANNTNSIMWIVTINYLTGSVNSSRMGGFDFPVYTSNLSMLSDGRILFTGGNKPENFTLSAKAFIITPARYVQTNLKTPLIKSISARWNKQAQAFVFNNEVASATLYNITGKSLYKTERNNRLSANDLSSGIYIVKIKLLNSNETQSLKVIKP